MIDGEYPWSVVLQWRENVWFMVGSMRIRIFFFSFMWFYNFSIFSPYLIKLENRVGRLKLMDVFLAKKYKCKSLIQIWYKKANVFAFGSSILRTSAWSSTEKSVLCFYLLANSWCQSSNIPYSCTIVMIPSHSYAQIRWAWKIIRFWMIQRRQSLVLSLPSEQVLSWWFAIIDAGDGIEIRHFNTVTCVFVNSNNLTCNKWSREY